MTLHQSGVDGISKRKFREILGNIIFLLVELELRSIPQSVLRKHLHDLRLERERGDVLVVDQVDLVKLDTRLDNLVCDSGGIGKGRDVFADLVEGKSEVLREGSAKLSFGFFTKDNNGRAFRGVSVTSGGAKLEEFSLGSLGDGRVDTSAQTLVGRNDNEELTTTLGSDGFGVGKDLCSSIG